MTTKLKSTKEALKVNSTYNVEIIVGSTSGHARPRLIIPKTKHIVQMKFIEKRANGVCVMERPAWICVDPPYTGKNKFKPGHELVKIKQQQIRGLAAQGKCKGRENIKISDQSGQVSISTLLWAVGLAAVFFVSLWLGTTGNDPMRQKVVTTSTIATTIPPTTTTTYVDIFRDAAPKASRSLARPRAVSTATFPDGSPCTWNDKSYCWTDQAWPALSACEAGMDPKKVSANRKYYGAFQFSIGTWHGIGMSGNPIDFPYEIQLEAAQRLQARSGWGQWPVCSRKLALR